MWIPEKAEKIIRELMAHGFEAYAVGGCVRDSILGREPGDWDITTSARPEQVKQIFHRTVDTGIEHGTVTVLIDKDAYEVTTYRVDGEYEDHRHPKEVTFTASLEEDLKRRDFTINAMAYNPETGLVDIFEGMQDLERKVIRCVGDSRERFDEDALRILRAIRFSAQLGFEIDEATKNAMTEKAETLKDVSAERIRVELVKLITSAHPEKIAEACRLGLTRVVLPEYDAIVGVEQHTPNHIYDVENHTLKALQAIGDDHMGGPGYQIDGEFAANGFKQNDIVHTTGVLSMARTMAPNSAGSQFFIMVAPAPHLDRQYAAFGKVFENEQVAIDISRVNRNMMNDKPKKDVVIESIRVDTLGVEYPEPETR